ncbi:TetR/AcrR family transcriptional regulator [Litoribrevibacter albus]|uniref:TetR family transcriptional regulator n=1 Tax=Litoribrevibacter albus TaxID=1473156 RepID=A0AA37W592_9GAMM|nr:TetR/AcrR family transcriptional regulator [Litoribrevibacter albus]GLQ30340.1 TetR family transcriptional regulator [Litoribrevibacter albus]
MAMGRPRKVDPDVVLEKALLLFREKGYEATSMSDLVAATGLHKGSLYQSFGDKHTLFKTALEIYTRRTFESMSAESRRADTATEGLQRALNCMLAIAAEGSAGSLGCMAVNAMVEFAERDADVRALLQATDQKIVALIMELSQRAVEEEGAHLVQPMEMTAMMLMSVMAGLGVTLKGMITLEQAQQVVKNQLSVLGFNKDLL